ncbi:FimV/HubP family polar landmark protein [Halomonas sp. DWK9]|uniref:FimV/HubP family polar landmark protein n=1 Tax=Halomonas sp. DWK9 TaxID=3060155 RepID=UPI00287F8D70|nr:FimV/HubP family polar landmark protein [Halomonas sp. DWK9]
MKKKLAWLLWLPLSAVSPLALAVGLGQATVNSPLQAPLDATVPLVDAANVALDDVRVEIANQAAFNALGLEWTPLAASVRAELQRLPSGAQLVLRSEQAVNEPWLDLLVTITTPGGRRTEALTLLFDPPDYASSGSSASSGNSTAPPAAATSAPATTLAAASPASPVVPSANVSRDIAYVASGDTLWGVAARIKPADVTVQQMMVALVAANPSAFPTGNVDDMRAGQTLSVPSREQLMARTPAQAAQSIQAMRQPTRSAPESEKELVSEREAEPEPSVSPAAPEATVEEGELAGLTLNDLAEQLRESQAMLQTVLDEREAMRAEMAALRQEVASLTAALNASQRETQRALAAAEARAADTTSVSNTARVSNPPAAVSPSVGSAPSTAASPGVIERLEQYQWPLASAALALLLGALVWARKRRERQWEDAPAPAGLAADVTPPKRAEPSVAATPKTEEAPKAAPPEESLYTPPRTDTAPAPSQADASSYEEAPDKQDSAPPKNETAFSLMEEEVSSNDSPVSDQWISDKQTGGEQEALRYEAVSSTAHSDDALGDDAPNDLADSDEVSSVTEEDEAALEAAFLDSPEPVQEVAYAPAEQKEDVVEATEKPVQEEDRAHYIDYHPPSLTSDTHGEEAGVGSQPSWSQRQESVASHSRREQEEEWEIEEVAFEPRRRDNSEPSKFSK